MSPPRSPFRLPIVALVVAGVLALAGCGGDEASPQEVVVRSSAATLDAGSARLYEEISMKGGPTAMPKTTLTGAMDFDAHRGTLTTRIAGQEVDAVLDGSTIYEKVPALSEQLGTPWLKINLDDIGELAGVQGLGDLGQAGSSDPTSTLAYLRGAGQVTEVGKERVRGEDTTHYRAVVDIERAARTSPAPQAKTLRQIAKVLGIARQPIDVWIDGDGRTRRMTETVDYTKADLPNVTHDQLPTSSTILVEYYDFGAHVSVAVPDPGDVTDFKDLLDEQQGAAAASATALEGKLIGAVPAGWQQQPDDVGDTGPSDLEKAVRDDGGDDARPVLTDDGFVAGYQRLWAKGDSQIVDFLYEFRTAGGAQDYRARTEAAGGGAASVAFDVPGVPGAKGVSASGPAGTTAVVTFTRDAFAVQLVVTGPDSTPELAAALARQQYDRLAGSES